MAGIVVVTDHVFGDLDVERSALARIGYHLEQAPNTDPATLADLAAHARGLLVCYAEIGQPVITAAARGGCRIIARYGIGVDNVDVEAATRAGIVVTNVPDYCVDEVADHAVALLLAATRGVVDAALRVRMGDWSFPRGGIRRLSGRRLTLVGVGRIGRRVAQRARAFGFEVVGYDPYVRDWDELELTAAPTLQEAVAEADAISLHVPLTDETRHLINERTIAMMRRSPVLVNTSRGGLVDLDAATAALNDGRLGRLALDVTEPEPLPPDHPLRFHSQAIVTPHMSFYSVEAQDELQRRAVDEVVRVLSGQEPRSPVNPKALKALTHR